jgi:hypothetical protein
MALDLGVKLEVVAVVRKDLSTISAKFASSWWLPTLW